MRSTAFTVALITATFSAAPIAAQDGAHRTMTLTGCLEASVSLAGFRLTNVEFDPSTAKGVPPAVGTSGKTISYEVTAKEGVDLSAHAGQKVAVTAVADEQAERQAPPFTVGDDKGPLPKLTILTLKIVSASCSAR